MRPRHLLAEVPFEIPVGVEAELGEPGCAGLCSRPAERLEELRQCRGKLAVGRQRHLVDVELRAGDRRVVEACEPRRDSADLGVELVVRDSSVHIAVLLRPGGVEVIGGEQDLECAAATDEP